MLFNEIILNEEDIREANRAMAEANEFCDGFSFLLRNLRDKWSIWKHLYHKQGKNILSEKSITTDKDYISTLIELKQRVREALVKAATFVNKEPIQQLAKQFRKNKKKADGDQILLNFSHIIYKKHFQEYLDFRGLMYLEWKPFSWHTKKSHKLCDNLTHSQSFIFHRDTILFFCKK